MTKGKPSFGKRHHTVHVLCRRCGRRAFHETKRVCSSCGFGKSSKIRTYAWRNKDKFGTVRRKK